MALSPDHHSLFLFREAAKLMSLAGSRWAFLGNQRLRGAPRKSFDRQRWHEFWGIELPKRELPKDAGWHLHSAQPWLEFFGAANVLLIDSNGKDGCLQHDLNKPLEAKYHGQFDVVANFGTSEHVYPKQLPCFKSIHDLCAPEGLMLHAVPSEGCNRHGDWRYPLAWMYELAKVQGYKIEHIGVGPVAHNRGTGPHLYAVCAFRKIGKWSFTESNWQDPPRAER